MRYDVHTHAFLPKIADKILLQLENHYGIPPVGNGLVEDLLAREERAGVEKVVIHNAATTPAQVKPANDWAISLQSTYPDKVMAFGTLHPGMVEWERELARLKAAGILGLKFHPEFQGFRLDDPKFKDLVEAALEDFIFLFHVGDRLPPAENASCPYKVAALLDEFPKARIIAAHMGGYLHWPFVREALVGRRVYMDTSSSLSFIAEEDLQDIFRRHPREYLLFGCDYPLFDPLDERILLKRRLALRENEVEEIMTNAGQLFGGE